MNEELPGAAGKIPEEGKQRGDTTGRWQRMLESELAPVFNTVKAIKWIVGIAIAVASAGFMAAMYFANFAKAADLDATREELHIHEREEAGKLGGLDAAVRALKDDHEWERRQIERIADRVGAQRVPTKEDR